MWSRLQEVSTVLTRVQIATKPVGSDATFLSTANERVYISCLDLLFGNQVLAVLKSFDLELVAFGSLVNILDVVYRIR
jgi:hypothetical protein